MAIKKQILDRHHSIYTIEWNLYKFYYFFTDLFFYLIYYHSSLMFLKVTATQNFRLNFMYHFNMLLNLEMSADAD
jgi:hypothetical protein